MINTNARLSRSQVKAICAKVKKQIHPLTAESKMFFAVFELAMIDNYSSTIRSATNKTMSSAHITGEDALSAAKYLRNAEEHLPAIGIDASWVARLVDETSCKRPTICQANPFGPHLP